MSCTDARGSADGDVGRGYHLDLTFRGECLVLRIAGPDGARRREHLEEVRRAADACGFPIVVTDRDAQRTTGMLA